MPGDLLREITEEILANIVWENPASNLDRVIFEVTSEGIPARISTGTPRKIA